MNPICFLYYVIPWKTVNNITLVINSINNLNVSGIMNLGRYIKIRLYQTTLQILDTLCLIIYLYISIICKFITFRSTSFLPITSIDQLISITFITSHHQFAIFLLSLSTATPNSLTFSASFCAPKWVHVLLLWEDMTSDFSGFVTNPVEEKLVKNFPLIMLMPLLRMALMFPTSGCHFQSVY